MMPSDIKLLWLLEELTLAANELTGSLPSQITSLLNLNSLSISYDKLKGIVAAELSNLKTLELFHLNSNNFDWSVDLFDYSVKSLIMDFSVTETSQGLATYSKCSDC